ncbi:unnamed protein product [Adineta ricciae]|uniref:Uncharacterized protein n=1 Tax=Adineta ricciae TaxID=249248 RepID=A0A816DBV0_ADIRI|nr:unnamed protein product [Adineta ricciae]
MGLRVDVHDRLSIPIKKAELDLNFINHFFDLGQLKSIDNFDNFKVPFDQLFDANQTTEDSSSHATPTRGKRQKLKHADSDSSLSSSSSASASSIHMDNLCNIDPNVLYPPFYIPPPGFIPRSPNSTEPSKFLAAGIAREISDQFLTASSSKFAGNGRKTNLTDRVIITWKDEDDDDEPYRVNGMPPGFRGYFQLFCYIYH